MVCMWFGDICYCSCLSVLPCPAWVLLSYVCKPFFYILYRARNNGLYVVGRMLQASWAEEVSNSRNKIHQTTYKPLFRALHIPNNLYETNDSTLTNNKSYLQIPETLAPHGVPSAPMPRALSSSKLEEQEAEQQPLTAGPNLGVPGVTYTHYMYLGHEDVMNMKFLGFIAWIAHLILPHTNIKLGYYDQRPKIQS